MDGYPLPEIPPHILQPGVDPKDIDAVSVFQTWITGLSDCIERDSYDQFPELFIDDCWWRDFVSLDWDFSTKHGQPNIIEYLSAAPNRLSGLRAVHFGGLKPLLVQLPGMVWIQGGFTFRNQHGTGRGLVKLLNVEGKAGWKAWSVFTQLESLDFQHELERQRNLNPAAQSHQGHTNGTNGSPESTRDETQVLIVGAGQAGLALGARLKDMGIKVLLADKHTHLGDAWRSRYHTLMLNTPTYTDHPPFMKIPENWPRWLSRDSVADFWEHYGSMMGLDVISGSEVTKIDYDESSRRYHAHLKSNEWSRVVEAKQVVLATGVYSDKPVLPEFAGQEKFNGRIYHSSDHKSALNIPGVEEKSVAIIGTGSSGHDIAQDFVSAGAKEVSIIQRHPIFYLSAESSEAIQLMLWNMEGLTTEEADIVGNATPIAVIRTMGIGMTHMMIEKDKDMISGLRKAGMALKMGEDGYGLADYQLIKGGSFYLDQGAGRMIVDGRIKIHHCEEGVKDFQPDGITLANHAKIKADVVVLTTGYHKNLLTVEKLLGPLVAQKMDVKFGQLDHENERSGWWRPTGQPGLWYMTGSLMWCRQFSLPLALQIAAVEKGLNEGHYRS